MIRRHSTLLIVGALCLLPVMMLGIIHALGPYAVGDNPGNSDGLRVFVWFAATVAGGILAYRLAVVASHRVRLGRRRAAALGAAVAATLSIFFVGLIPWVYYLSD